MPKNKGKGGKNRRRGKNEADNQKQELVFREDGQEYGRVMKMLGNSRVRVKPLSGENLDEMIAHIRGKMRKKVWINTGDIILLALREFQDDVADVIQKYTPDEARSLAEYGEIPKQVADDLGGPSEEAGDGFTFGGVDEDDEDSGSGSSSDSDDSDDIPAPKRMGGGKPAKGVAHKSRKEEIDIDDI